MISDYNDFLKTPDQKPPRELDNSILGAIKNEMQPSKKNIFLKILSIQAFISTITLLFCPQFNFSLTNSYAIFHLIHQTFGHHICMIICGAIFIGSGALFTGLILNRYEVRIIRRSYPLYYVALTGMAITVFLFIGTELYIDMVALWALGAIGSSCLFFQTGKLFKVALER